MNLSKEPLNRRHSKIYNNEPVLGQNGSGQNGMDKMVYGQNVIGQNGTDKMV